MKTEIEKKNKVFFADGAWTCSIAKSTGRGWLIRGAGASRTAHANKS